MTRREREREGRVGREKRGKEGKGGEERVGKVGRGAGKQPFSLFQKLLDNMFPLPPIFPFPPKGTVSPNPSAQNSGTELCATFYS